MNIKNKKTVHVGQVRNYYDTKYIVLSKSSPDLQLYRVLVGFGLEYKDQFVTEWSANDICRDKILDIDNTL